MDTSMEMLKFFADKYRGKNKTSGPHWSAVIRIPWMYDEIVRLKLENDYLQRKIAILEDENSERSQFGRWER